MESDTYSGPAPYFVDDRDFGHFSDHLTVWVDKYIGVKDTYGNFKSKFDNNIQVLHSNNMAENEIDDDTMLFANPGMLKKLMNEVYCLKYFPTTAETLQCIQENVDKKIFFISSGSMGREIVPQIAELPQIYGIYIFCGDISKQVDWAGDYAEKISAMLEHQDDLLVRLTRDIAEYLEKKGDQYKIDDEIIKARNCYSWAKKLVIRAQQLGDCNAQRLIDKLKKNHRSSNTNATSKLKY